MIHLDNLKELAKKFRLHKSIPNFFRDYTTEDSLVAVLKRYVRNNAAFLSLAPSSVARARRSGGGHPHTDQAAGTSGVGGAGGGGGDAQQTIGTIGKTSSMDSASLLDGGASLGSGGPHGTADDASSVLPTKTTTSGDSENHHPQHHTAGGTSFVGVLSSEALHPGGPGGGGMSTGQVSRTSGHNTNASAGPNAMGSHRGHRISESSPPRRPVQPKRPTKVGGNSYVGPVLIVELYVPFEGAQCYVALTGSRVPLGCGSKAFVVVCWGGKARCIPLRTQVKISAGRTLGTRAFFSCDSKDSCAGANAKMLQKNETLGESNTSKCPYKYSTPARCVPPDKRAA